MLYYVPLEPYRERYTMQLSAPKTGWMEREWIKHHVEYRRVDGVPVEGQMPLAKGVVLDPLARSCWGFEQTKRLIGLAYQGDITNRDVIYFDDFWHPGFEMLPYAFHQLNITPRMYAQCWAQSADRFDFTFGMRQWIRHFERGIGECLDGVFVACPTLKEELVESGLVRESAVHVTGLPWSTNEVMGRMPVWYQNGLVHPGMDPLRSRKNQVVFSSRLDKEKNPHFMLDVATQVCEYYPDDIKFVICASSPELRSNDPTVLDRIEKMRKAFDWLDVRTNLSKEDYYATLCESKVQFNCADQDWVSFTLLEASAAGCYPVYPYFRSFPETFLEEPQFFYKHKDVASAANKITSVLKSSDLWTPEEINARSWIHRRFDSTWSRQALTMRISHVCPPEECKDPFSGDDWLL